MSGRHPRLAPLTAILSLLMPALLAPSSALAQIQPMDVTDSIAPEVHIVPSGGTYADSLLQVTVYWCDDKDLDDASRLIEHGSTDVTSSFTYQSIFFAGPCTNFGDVYESVGTINLADDTELSASIEDEFGHSDSDQASYSLQDFDPPTVSLPKHNGDNRDRSLCLTSGAGEAAAYQCGDLMVAHPMPAYRTKGRDRSLTLVYNSEQATPRAVAIADVGFDANSDPDSAEIRYWMGGVEVASAVYHPANWQDQTYQLSIGFVADTLPTGLHPFELTGKAFYPSTMETSDPVSDTMIVVNRRDSPFGLGWSLAGVEQLVLDQPGGTGDDLLWVGGDGSARRYREVSANTWRGAEGTFRNTITLSGGTYTRHLKHGVTVEYDSAGRHVRTINRTQDTTTFAWTLGRLTSIQVPTAGATTRDTYTLHYSGSPAALDSIVDPAGRVLATSMNGADEITEITDPDGESVTFTYSAAGRMRWRYDRRGFGTKYSYDEEWRLTDAQVTVDASGPTYGHTRFKNWDESWLALGVDDTATTSRYSTVRTTINGPRLPGDADDRAYVWIDRWGAPTKIQDPEGNVTRIDRGEGGSPAALPTSIEYPDGRVVAFQWNARANLTLQTDSATTAESEWFYGDSNAPDSPDSLVAPDGEVTTFTYTAGGLTDEVTAPNGQVTDFDYGSGDERGLVVKITEESVKVLASDTVWSDTNEDLETTFSYDDWGNVEDRTSPIGNTTAYRRDSKNRVVRVVDAVGDSTGRSYDALNRVTATHVYTSSGTLTTTRDWGVDFLEEVIDPRGVTRGFEYDDGGRLVKEIDEQGEADEFGYDPAGNRIWKVSRNLAIDNDTVHYAYDAKNRLTTTSWPEVEVEETDECSPIIEALYGQCPEEGKDWRAPADSITRTYDSMNRLATIENYADTAAFEIERSYRKDGLILSEIRTDKTVGHTASVRYDYSAGGKRILHVVGDPSHPSGTAPDSVWRDYDPNTGELEKIVVEWGYGSSRRDSVRFQWDDLGRRKRLIYSDHSGTSAPIDLEFSYDMDGRLRRICSTHGGSVNPSHRDVFDLREARSYNADGTLNTRTMEDESGDTACPNSNSSVDDTHTEYTYDERKQTIIEDSNTGTTEIEYDDSGNVIERAEYFSGGSIRALRQFVFPDSSNRVDQFLEDTVHTPTSVYTYWYFPNGTRALDQHSGGWGYRWYLLDGLDRLAGLAFHGQCNPTISFRLDEVGALHRPYYDGSCELSVTWSNDPICEYDPLGRLMSPCGSPVAGRMTFDGDNVVRSGQDDDEWHWSFVDGPGTDDPIMGHKKKDGAGGHTYYYFVTDGAGRQLAVGENVGEDVANPDIDDDSDPNGSRNMPYMTGAQFAGGIHSSFGFTPERHPRGDLPGLAFFRNRWYDQATSRWLSEDPIGLAGGVNLYQYAGNNPASYTDPFGLCPIPPSNCVDVAFLALDVVDFVKDPSWSTLGGVGLGAAALVPGIPSVSGAKRFAGTAYEIGRAGEKAAGIAKNTRRIPSLSGSAAYRIPDGLTTSTLSEVKNVGRLSYTRQLRDFAAYAKESGRTFDLYVRPNTELSGPLQEAITNGDITLRFLK